MATPRKMLEKFIPSLKKEIPKPTASEKFDPKKYEPGSWRQEEKEGIYVAPPSFKDPEDSTKADYFSSSREIIGSMREKARDDFNNAVSLITDLLSKEGLLDSKSAFINTEDDIKNIAAKLHELPVDSLDQAGLKKRLELLKTAKATIYEGLDLTSEIPGVLIRETIRETGDTKQEPADVAFIEHEGELSETMYPLFHELTRYIEKELEPRILTEAELKHPETEIINKAELEAPETIQTELLKIEAFWKHSLETLKENDLENSLLLATSMLERFKKITQEGIPTEPGLQKSYQDLQERLPAFKKLLIELRPKISRLQRKQKEYDKAIKSNNESRKEDASAALNSMNGEINQTLRFVYNVFPNLNDIEALESYNDQQAQQETRQ